jgi:ribosome-binding protein aMBF1 (putative translation factor)
MAKKMTKDAAKIIDRMIGDDPELREMIEQETINAQVARTIHDAREAARLTQAALARLVGTTQSVIARLEDADYEGHSLTMLKRIANALGKGLQIRLVPLGKRRNAKAVA